MRPSKYDAMVCMFCGWSGDIWELTPSDGEDFGHDLCPECSDDDVRDTDELTAEDWKTWGM